MTCLTMTSGRRRLEPGELKKELKVGRDVLAAELEDRDLLARAVAVGKLIGIGQLLRKEPGPLVRRRQAPGRPATESAARRLIIGRLSSPKTPVTILAELGRNVDLSDPAAIHDVVVLDASVAARQRPAPSCSPGRQTSRSAPPRFATASSVQTSVKTFSTVSRSFDSAPNRAVRSARRERLARHRLRQRGLATNLHRDFAPFLLIAFSHHLARRGGDIGAIP